MLTLTCEECGRKFEKNIANERQRIERGLGGPYCSPKCFHSSQRGRETVDLTCIECGDEFTRYVSDERAAKKERKAGPFCSKPCTSRYYAKKNKPWEAKQAPLIDRFMEKWEYDEGCWRWTASVDGRGYGQIRGEGEDNLRAHHVSFEAFHGRAPREGRDVHHTCENRRCVNPMHLQELTRSEHAQAHAKAGRRETP